MTVDCRTEQRRQNYLEYLYKLFGRTDGLYTGLYQQRLQELTNQDMASALDAQHQT